MGYHGYGYENYGYSGYGGYAGGYYWMIEHRLYPKLLIKAIITYILIIFNNKVNDKHQ